MTTLVAIKRNDEVWIGADKQTQYGSTKRMYNKQSKIVRACGFAFAFSGSCVYQNLFEIFVDQFSEIGHTRKELFSFFNNFNGYASEKLKIGTSDNNDPQALSMHVIAATPTNVYAVLPAGSIFDVDTFVAAGGGEEYATGALECLYPSDLSNRDVIKRAIDIASKHSTGTGGGTDIIQVTPKKVKA